MTRTGCVRRPRLDSLAVCLLLGLMMSTIAAEAAEIIPSVGITKSSRPGASDQAQLSGGLAVRGELLPMLKSEIGVSYRSEDRMNGAMTMRMWPVTASLWLTPLPALYAGGGVGWYHTTLDYSDAVALPSETHQDFGVHVGGGLRVPFTSAVALDLNGRYVFLHDQESRLLPTTFDPDFWTTSVGLAIKF